MIKYRVIDINDNYYIRIRLTKGKIRFYILIEKETNKTIIETFNKNDFLNKVNKIVDLSNEIKEIIENI